MSELGELLELMYGARGRWRTARFVVRDRVDFALSQEAQQRLMERQSAGGGSVQVMVSFSATAQPEPPAELVTTTKVWVEGDRYRAELEQLDHRTVTVCDGTQIWFWSPEMGAVVHDVSNSFSGWEAILDPRPFLAAGELEPAGRGIAAGRDALVVVGRMPPGAPHWHVDGLPPGATDFELLVDAERGTVLRCDARLDGRPFSLREVLEIAYDEPLPAATFVFEPGPGETVRTFDEAYPVEHLSLDGVARRASFTVWVPPELAEGWRVHAVYMPARERSPEHVTISCFHERGANQFQLHEGAAEGLPELEGFARVEHGGLELATYVPEGRRAPVPTVVALDRDGTRIQLSSAELGLDALLDLAVSLVPAPTEPPQILA